MKDNYTGRSKGFGFVEMPAKAEAQSAIEGLNGKDLKAAEVAQDMEDQGVADQGMTEDDAFG